MIKFASALGERRPEEVVSWQMTLTLPSSMSSSCKVATSDVFLSLLLKKVYANYCKYFFIANIAYE